MNKTIIDIFAKIGIQQGTELNHAINRSQLDIGEGLLLTWNSVKRKILFSLGEYRKKTLSVSYTEFINGSTLIKSIPANRRIEKLILSIKNAFTLGSDIQIGTSTDNSLIVDLGSIDLDYTNYYVFHSDNLIIPDTDLNIYYSGSPTSGDLECTVYFS